MGRPIKYPLHREVALRLAAEGRTAREIVGSLATDDHLPVGEAPDVRTVERWVAAWHKQRGDDPWSIEGADPADAAVVLAATAVLAWATQSRRNRMTTVEAEWTVKVARSAPTIPPHLAFQVGTVWRDRVARGRDPTSIEIFLGAAPWADPKLYGSIVDSLIEQGVTDWLAIGWDAGLDRVIARHYAGVCGDESSG